MKRPAYSPGPSLSVTLLLAITAILALAPAPAAAQAGTPAVSPPVPPVLSPPLRDIPPVTTSASETPREIENEQLPVAGRAAGAATPVDPVVQPTPGSTLIVPTGVNFDGVGVSNSAPPDTVGRVGPNHYVQWVNTRFAIYSKTGALLYGPADGKTLWQSLGGTCAVHNDGDPIAEYDLMADRWVLTQFTAPTADGSHQCVAVSKTGDPLGQYYLYDFHTSSTDFVDYPHWGMWPDSYYMAAHLFSLPNLGFNTQGLYAFEREAMLAGLPARFQFASLDGFFGALPSDLDSLTPPPPGSPNTVAAFGSPESDSSVGYVLHLWQAQATWGTSPTFTVTGPVDLDVAPFDSLFPTCLAKGIAGAGRGCIAQPSPALPPDYLDAIGDRLMYRLAYRNFGDHETLVVNHSVNLGAEQAGVRWYEVRDPGGAATVIQQGTYAPADPAAGAASRWMGSIAMDNGGNIALGYSKSSLTLFPEIDVAGRLAGDPLNMMGAEVLMQAGLGVQIGTDGRWGDYSAMTVDPRDGCTFWYTNQYLPDSNPAGFNWKTRIASFRFPAGSCAPPPQGTLSGTVRSCATGAPLPNAIVRLDNGFSGAADGQGRYSIVVPPGTYTATATAQGRVCQPSASVSGIVIADGGTVTRDFCLDGSTQYALGNVTIHDGDGNGNGFINRDECVELTVPIQNDGCAVGTGIAATLTTTTPNVSVVQGDSAYPDLAIDAGGANTTPYRLVTAPAFVCGTPIALRLAVNDASGTSSTLDFSLPTCGGGPPQIRMGDLSTTDATQSARLGRDGAPSGCEGPKQCPGPLGTGNRFFDQYTFTNEAEVEACITIQVDAACGGGADMSSAAYLGSYDPQDICANYLGDSGVVGLGSTLPSASYSVRVPAHQDLVVIANTNTELATCASYKLTVSGFFDPTPAGSCLSGTPPVAVDDQATTFEDTPITIDVLANDSDGGSPPLNISSVTQPAHGAVTNNGNGTVTYAPEPGFNSFFGGPDSFQYTVSNASGLSDTATVAVTVNPLCTYTPAGDSFSDFESGAQGWTVETATNAGTVNWTIVNDATVSNPLNQSFFSDDPMVGPKDDRLVSPPVNVSSTSQIQFSHRFNTEDTFDGGVLEVSLDGGATWRDIVAAGGVFLQGGYNSFATGFSGAWSGMSAGYPSNTAVAVDLGQLAGLGRLFRFRMVADSNLGIEGWHVDDVRVTNTFAVGQCRAATSTSVVSNNNPSTFGQSVTFTATVSSSASGTPTGTVLFRDGTAELGSGTLNASGQASFATSSLSAGSHPITAEYGGDTGFAPSMSPPLTQTVNANPRSTATSVSCTPSVVEVGDATQCKATVTDTAGGGASTPTGTVSFSSSGAGAFGSGSCTLDANGTCSVSYAATAVGTGTHTITASYGGSGVHAPSSGSTAVTVTSAGTAAGKVTGAGEINVPGGAANFGFNVKRDAAGGPIKGKLDYQNHARGLNVRSVSVTSLNISGTTATFAGSCTKNGAPCTFSVTVEDNGESGRIDRFTIGVSGEPVEGGRIVRGNIQVHKP